MKKVIYGLVVLLAVAGGLVFANRTSRTVGSQGQPKQPLSAAQMKSERQQWEASPDGLKFKKWEASPIGQKVLAAASKIRYEVNHSVKLHAVISSLTPPPGTRLGFALMAQINGEEYILSFTPDSARQLQELQKLRTNDKIILKSHSVSYAPKYAYAILSGDYVERDAEIIYKRTPRKGGC